MSRKDQPQTLYNLSELVEGGDQQFDVGVLIAPDVTSPFVYHPYTFKKTISFRRSFDIHGIVTINGEEVYDTPNYCSGFEAIEDCQKRLAKLKIGEGVVTLKVTDDPIIVLPPEKERHSWDRERREYFPVPPEWFNITTKAGQDFFEQETREWNKPWEERFERRNADDSYYERLNANKFNTIVHEHVLWSSTDTPEQNHERLVDLMTKYKVKFDDREVRRTLGMRLAA